MDKVWRRDLASLHPENMFVCTSPMVKPAILDPGAGKEHNHWGLRESGLGGIEEHAASPVRHTHTALSHLALCLLNLGAPEPQPHEWDKTQSQALIQRKGKTRKLQGEAGRTREGRRRSTDLSPCKPFRVNGKHPQPQTRQVLYMTLLYFSYSISLIWVPCWCFLHLQIYKTLISFCTC